MSSNDDDQDRKSHHRPWGNHGFRHMDRFDRLYFGQRGFLRPQIIQIFAQQPMNGVEIMSKLQEMSHGWYKPSPGSIYPLLEQLEKEGIIAKNKDGKFELTAEYAEQTGIGHDVRNALSAMESNISYLEDLQKADAAALSKWRDRVEKLLKRLEALNSTLQSTRRGP